MAQETWRKNRKCASARWSGNLLGAWVPEAQDPHESFSSSLLLSSLSPRPTQLLRIYLLGFFIQSYLDSTLGYERLKTATWTTSNNSFL
ncbi:hypothetical protein ACN38_g2955 [Penicillium nordicum]|uniref:Uncharacterized protein n=1 Tax=Penicillium nordicum TaxID=229535 RepID=A0A0M8P6G2_9EURO|nr:hypothetical protein ACN38_g2955 [Penicillium nordicum]